MKHLIITIFCLLLAKDAIYGSYGSSSSSGRHEPIEASECISFFSLPDFSQNILPAGPPAPLIFPGEIPTGPSPYDLRMKRVEQRVKDRYSKQSTMRNLLDSIRLGVSTAKDVEKPLEQSSLIRGQIERIKRDPWQILTPQKTCRDILPLRSRMESRPDL